MDRDGWVGVEALGEFLDGGDLVRGIDTELDLAACQCCEQGRVVEWMIGCVAGGAGGGGEIEAGQEDEDRRGDASVE